jgi:hypothetical protein
MVVIVRAAIIWVPLVGRAPVQPPEPVQPVALVELQVSVVVPPLAIVVGAALIEAVGIAVDAGGSPPPPQAINNSKALIGSTGTGNLLRKCMKSRLVKPTTQKNQNT